MTHAQFQDCTLGLALQAALQEEDVLSKESKSAILDVFASVSSSPSAVRWPHSPTHDLKMTQEMNKALFTSTQTAPKARVKGTLVSSNGVPNHDAGGQEPVGAPPLTQLHCADVSVTGVAQPLDLPSLTVHSPDFAASSRKGVPAAQAAIAAACGGAP